MISVKSRTTRLAIGALAMAWLCACSSTTPIQPAKSSKSSFEGAVFNGETVKLADNPGIEEHRVFHQAATGFVSVASVRQSAERRAAAFCAKSGKQVLELSESHSVPPHILGNFPRVEIVFGCVDGSSGDSPPNDGRRYQNLKELKALLDSGAITDAEYEKEKQRILNQP